MNLSDDLIHKIKNLLGSIQIFLNVVETSAEDPKLHTLHQTCKENMTLIKELLKPSKAD